MRTQRQFIFCPVILTLRGKNRVIRNKGRQERIQLPANLKILKIFEYGSTRFYTALNTESFVMHDFVRCKCVRNHAGGRSMRVR